MKKSTIYKLVVRLDNTELIINKQMYGFSSLVAEMAGYYKATYMFFLVMLGQLRKHVFMNSVLG